VASRPVIGIPTQTQEAIIGQAPRAWILGQKYVRVLAPLGAVPWLIPLLPFDEDTLRATYERLDGLFIAGGVDVDPSQYGEEDHLCGNMDRDRDWAELTLLRWCLADRKPVLGICRGMQVLNVAAGGSLYQDIGTQLPGAIKHDYFSVSGNYPRDFLAHEVRAVSGSRLGAVFGGDPVRVNSMHHQGIKKLGAGVMASAYAPDGLIEGIEGADGQYLVAVQWHPEELAEHDPATRRLFANFITAAAKP
jgi:putative glutamine amidotransferase